LTTALALSYSQVKKAHIAIEMVTDRLPPRARAALVGVMRLVSLALFVLMTWQLAGYATNIRRLGTLSETLRISYYPLVYLVALGVAAFCLRLLVETLSGFRGRRPA
jgi:TRAP-type C4-dicarboxylate transport system permease small subunit